MTENNSENIINNIVKVRKAGRPVGTFRKKIKEPLFGPNEEPKKKSGRPKGSFTKTLEEKRQSRREWMKEHYKSDPEAHERHKESMRLCYQKNRQIIIEAKKNMLSQINI